MKTLAILSIAVLVSACTSTCPRVIYKDAPYSKYDSPRYELETVLPPCGGGVPIGAACQRW